MNWAVIAGAVAALCVMGAGIAALRGRRAKPIDVAKDAARAAEAALAGFAACGAIIGDDGAAALVVGRGARVAVVKPHGKALSVCEIDWRAIRITPAGALVETGNRRFGDAVLAGVDALDIRRLAPSAAEH